MESCGAPHAQADGDAEADGAEEVAPYATTNEEVPGPGPANAEGPTAQEAGGEEVHFSAEAEDAVSG